MLENLFKSGGRISRKQYQSLFGGLAAITMFFPMAALITMPLYFLSTSKRLHDLGYSGKYALLGLFPPLGILMSLALVFKDGEVGHNEYGPDPLGGHRGRGSFQNRMSTGMRETPGIFGPISDMFKGGVKNKFKGFYDKAGSNGETHPVDFIFSLMLLGSFVIKHDKKVDDKELEFVFAFLKKHFDEKKAQAGMQLLEQMLERDWDLNGISRQVKLEFNYTTKLYLMHYLYGIAHSDNKFNEGALLKRIGFKIGVDDQDLLEMGRFWKKNRVEDASEKVFQADLDTKEWDGDDLAERMDMTLAKMDPERVIDFGEKVTNTAKKQADETWKSFKKKFPGQMSLEQRLQAIDDQKAWNQYKELKQRFSNFLDVLSRKLNVEEMTYKRYKKIAEEVYMSGMKNLEKIADGFQFIDTEDMGKMKKQATESGGEESIAINKRLALYEEEMNKIKNIYIENEQAITQMDEAIFSLNNLETQGKDEAMDMKDSMTELEEWTRRVKLYQK